MGSKVVVMEVPWKDFVEFRLMMIRVAFGKFLRAVGYYRLLYNMRSYLIKIAIKAKLRAKGKNELEVINTHIRWLSRRHYTSEQRCKKLRKENDQTLVKLSNDINIPQWDLRTYFEDE